MRTENTARTFAAARAAAFAGLVALAALTGCAPEPEGADVSPVTADNSALRPALPARAPVLEIAPGVIRADLARVGDAQRGVPLHGVPTTLAPGVFDAARPFDFGAFAEEVARAGAAHGQAVASLPAYVVVDAAQSDARVEQIVARSSFDVRVVADRDLRPCGGDAVGCAAAFTRELEDVDRALSNAMAPVAQRLLAARDLRVTRWTSVDRGVVRDLAVTLHGRLGDKLVGVVVFR